jgi:uncharacterized membrane protein
MTPQPEIRIGDAEREAAVAALGEHYAAGRLTKEEYDERAAVAWTAKTNSALWPLFADLPRPQAAPRQVHPAVRARSSAEHWAWWLMSCVVVLFLGILAIKLLTHVWLVPLVGLLWLFWARKTNPARRAQRWERRHSWDHRWDRR